MADVKITDEAVEQFTKLPLKIQDRVERIVDRLRTWPHVSGAKPLRGNLAGSYRIRTGDYRVRFRVSGNIVIIEKIGYRKDMYES